MATEVVFTVPGDVVPWARAGRGKGFTFTPARQRNYMGVLRSAAHEAMHGMAPMSGPCRLVVTADYPWPKSTTKKRRAAPDGAWKDTKPDADNITKIVKDALSGIVFVDDAQCAEIRTVKRLADAASLRVEVTSLVGTPVEIAA
jgi:Holliday junction resolvase RusA-like endonuclease